MNKVIAWLRCRFWCCGVNDTIHRGESELTYRFFRFKYFYAKKELNKR